MVLSRITRISATIAVVAAAVALPVTSAIASDPCDTGPRLTGTFVQPALIDGWSNAQLDNEFGHLDDACIDTHVLQWTADSGAHTAIFDTGLSGYTQNTSTDVVDRLLSTAEGRNAAGTYSFTVDLGVSRSIGLVETGWLQVRGDYVFLPPSVKVETSTDALIWTTRGTITEPAVTDSLQVKNYRLLVLTASARYVRVTVDGGSAWTMLDEILIKG